MASNKFTITPIDNSDGLVAYIKDHCQRILSCDIWISPPKCALPSIYLKDLERIYNMEVRPDDTWVITFPKCGTTWTQEMVWLLGNQCNFEKAKSESLMERFPFMELNSIGVPRFPSSFESTLEQSEKMPSPRFIKSHLPYELLPHQLWTVKPKIIYTCRNPLAVVVSYYHHFRLFNSYKGDFEHFLDAFLKDQIDYGPFWNHILGFWKLRKEPNIYFNFFEDMKDDLQGVITKVGKFLGTELDELKIAALADHLSFSSMKNNPMVNLEFIIQDIYGKDTKDHAFIRKGEKDEWKTAIPPEYLDKFKQWNRKWKTGTDFDYY